MQGQDRRVLDALAAAQAVNGQYDRAVRTAQRALDAPVGLAGNVADEDVLRRIELYKENRPYEQSVP